jgi:putative transposase
MIIYKTYKFRLYPNKDQKILIEKHIGASRFVYNFFLAYSSNAYKNTKTSTNVYDWSKVLTKLKKTQKYSWLNEINSHTLQASLFNLDNAFKKFYKKQASYPRFKKKKSSTSFFTISDKIKLNFSKINTKFGYLSIPKCRNDPIKVRIHRMLPNEYEIKRAIITRTKTNKYYVSLVVKCPSESKVFSIKYNNNGIGIKFGIRDTIVLSTGEKYNLPIKHDQYDKKIKTLQKSLARKYNPDSKEQSKNYEKTRIKLAKVYEKITNIKNDWIQKTTSKLIAENQGKYFFLQDVDIKNMAKNRKLSKQIYFQSWYKFKQVLTYKANWAGKEIIIIDKYKPITKTCNVCGYINEKLNSRSIEWTCPQCGSQHDRNINAAINIKNFGMEQLQKM